MLERWSCAHQLASETGIDFGEPFRYRCVCVLRRPRTVGGGHGTLRIPQEVLQHRAGPTARDGTPFREMVGTLQRTLFAFPLPAR
jgi:hypothetical protein